jgi:hypothetical protein
LPFAKDPADNLAILETMVDELEPYLESNDLVRQLVIQTGDQTYAPKMSIGLVLDHLQTLQRDLADLAPPDRVRLEEASHRFTEIRGRRRDAYAAKLRRELKSHMDSWSWFLDRCAEGEEGCVDDYPAETRIRTRIEELMDEARAAELPMKEEAARLSELDQRLDDMFRRGPYSGATGDASEYPPDRYWWLYGRPRV